jgi:CHAT domain-containing protein
MKYFLILLFPLCSFGQGALQGLKKSVMEKAKTMATKERLTKAGNLMLNDLDKMRAEFDSSDFDYSIIVTDNAGVFNVREKGEAGAKMISGANLFAKFKQDEAMTDLEKARIHLEFGEITYAQNKYAFAEKRFATARELFENGRITEDIGYSKTIANQGLLFATMGRFTQAEACTAEALELRKAMLGETNAGVAASYNNYSVLKYNLGKYNEAEKDIHQALSILEQNNLQNAMQYAIVLNNEAMLYQTIGRYEASIKNLQQAIATAEKLQNSRSRNHLKFVSNLALLYQQTGKYTEAEELYLSAQNRLSKTSPDYAGILTNLALLYRAMGKNDKVEEPLKKALTIYKQNFGEDNSVYAKAMSDLGNFYRSQAKYAEAEPLLTKALAVREKTLGTSHPLYAQSQEDLAIYYWKKGENDQAYTLYKSVMDRSLEFINDYFPPMSEAEKTRYWDVLSPRFQRFYNFASDYASTQPTVANDLYDYHIATKALLLNSTNKIKQSIIKSQDAALIKDYFTWLDQKETLARLYAYTKEELKDQKINLDSVERATNTMEKRISERSKDFSAGYAAQKIAFSQIAALLSDQEAVVEVVRVRSYDQNFTEDSHYLALVLTKNSKVPTLIKLDNGQQLETRYAKYYRNAIQQKQLDNVSYEQYWSKIEPTVAGKKVLYLSLDGVYNQLNLNTLQKTGGDYLVKKYELILLSNSKDLLAIKNRKPATPAKKAFLLGFPDYGGPELATLPGTKTELEGISKMLKTSGYTVSQFIQKEATEKNLKSLKAPELIHIATHGYFLKDVETGGNAFGVSAENASDNPLLRSGLMLAGASKTISGVSQPNLESNDNGVLTAYEAMNLNLEGTSLVILSACETGLGEVKSGEGVYGLQRAFFVAGADALIMSLWKVDDAATQLLMTNFYTNWIKLHDKQKAFKQAQLQLMTKYKEPYYWGAFVMIGN